MDTPNVGMVVTRHNGRPHCAIRGDIDLLTAPTVGQALASFIEVGETAIELDLSDVEFIDARGIHELIVARRAGLRILITGASAAARRTLDVAGINGFLSD